MSQPDNIDDYANDDNNFVNSDMSDFMDAETILENNRFSKEKDFIKDFIDDEPALPQPAGKPASQKDADALILEHMSVAEREKYLRKKNGTPEQEFNEIIEDDPEEEDAELNFNNELNLPDDEQKELEELNKKFGTDFKSTQELKDMLKGKQAENVEQNEIATLETKMQNLNGWINMKDLDLLWIDHSAGLKNQGKDADFINASKQGFMDEMEMKDEEVIMLRADRIRNELKEIKKGFEGKVNEFRGQIAQREKEKEEQFKTKLQEAVIDIHKRDSFYGLKLTNKQYLAAYNKATKNSLIEHIKNNPQDAVELQLFLDNRELISKVAGKPTYSEGIKDTFQAVKGQSPKSAQQVRKNPGADDPKSFIARFVS